MVLLCCEDAGQRLFVTLVIAEGEREDMPVLERVEFSRTKDSVGPRILVDPKSAPCEERPLSAPPRHRLSKLLL